MSQMRCSTNSARDTHVRKKTSRDMHIHVTWSRYMHIHITRRYGTVVPISHHWFDCDTEMSVLLLTHCSRQHVNEKIRHCSHQTWAKNRRTVRKRNSKTEPNRTILKSEFSPYGFPKPLKPSCGFDSECTLSSVPTHSKNVNYPSVPFTARIYDIKFDSEKLIHQYDNYKR